MKVDEQAGTDMMPVFVALINRFVAHRSAWASQRWVLVRFFGPGRTIPNTVFYSNIGLHWNERGHAVVADGIAQLMDDLGVPTSSVSALCARL
jgi:hypothetical protein